MAGDVTLKIDADVAAYIAKVARASTATKGMAKDTSGIGNEIIKATAKMEVLKRAAEAAGRAVAATLSASVDASKSAGSRAVSLATSFGSLGVKDISGASKRLIDSEGAATSGEREAFLSSLVGVNKSRQAPMSADEAVSAAGAYARYGDLMFGKGGEELREGLANGRSVEEITRTSSAKRNVSGALSDTSGALAQELSIRRKEDKAALRSDENRRAAGIQVRAGAASNQIEESGGGFFELYRNITGAIPGMTEAQDAKAGQDAGWGVRQELETQTRIMRDALTRPNFNTTTGGQ